MLSILPDTYVTIGPQDVEVCRRQEQVQKTIIRLVNHRYVKKALINRKKLDSIDNAKYNFDARTKIFINENLSLVNKSIAYNCRKLRQAKIVNSKPEKIHHMRQLWDLFPDLAFLNDEEGIPHYKHDVVNVSNSGTV